LTLSAGVHLGVDATRRASAAVTNSRWRNGDTDDTQRTAWRLGHLRLHRLRLLLLTWYRLRQTHRQRSDDTRC